MGKRVSLPFMVFIKSDKTVFNLRFSDVNLCSDNINQFLLSLMETYIFVLRVMCCEINVLLFNVR